MPRAPRAPRTNCAASAVTNANARLQVVIARANATEPAAGSPSRISAAASAAASTPLAAEATARPAVSGACLPTAAEPTSSSRPASSSALVCLTTRKMLISEAKMAAHTPYRQALTAPSEVPSMRPYRNSSEGLLPPLAARSARSAAVGYRCRRL
ncbi:MAG TPA: hypothetical protein VE343_17575 [Streptosporangiaceae bacterium]|nr:hypothetical protein [Streptosporangiaceae bacterium]